MTVLDNFFRGFASESAANLLLPHRTLWRAWRRRRPVPTLGEARSILVVRLDEIGDVVLTSAFFRELRRNAPTAHITALVNPLCASLLRACPYLDSIETFSDVKSSWSPRYWARLRLSALGRNFLRSFTAPFDLVLLPRRSPDFHEGEFLAFSSGFGCIVALDDQAAPANLNARYRRSLQEFRFPVTMPCHDVDYSLTLLEYLGGKIHDRSLEAWTTSADDAEADHFLHTHLIPGRAFAVLHPSGGNSALKQWPVKNFSAVVQSLSREFAIQWLIVGGPDEMWIHDKFPRTDAPRVVPVPGLLPIRTLIAVLRRARLFVGGDSGPMHLAAAAGLPVIAAFGPTSELRFSPRGVRTQTVSLHFPCSPDATGTFIDRCQACIYPSNRCLEELSTEAILTVARTELQRN